MSKVIIAISGGIADLIEAPENTEVIVRDYDIEGLDDPDDPNIKKDEDGNSYIKMEQH